MALYSYRGTYPREKPHRIKLSDGTVRTDNTTFTKEMLADAGWIEVEDPPIAEFPNKVEWSVQDQAWYTRGINDAEKYVLRMDIKQDCIRQLTETDFKVIKAVEAGVAIDSDMRVFRQDLRDLYNNIDNIDEPWTVDFPSLKVPKVPL